MSEKSPDHLTVAVVFGGRSGEHEVSLMSARSIIAAMDPHRFRPLFIGITKEGKWITGDDPMAVLAGEAADHPAGRTTGVVLDPDRPALVVIDSERPHAIEKHTVDVVFPVLHGPFGEDGTIQGLLDMAGIPYVGCGVAASAVGMDKAFMKQMFQGAGLPIVDHIVTMQAEWEREPQAVQRRVRERIGFPCFVKPANLGSSVGISKATNSEELARALDEAARFDRKLLVEQSAEGFAEIECSVLGNEDPEASIPGEIVPGGAFYDYDAKYIDDTSELIIPARLSDGATKRVQELSIAAFQAIDGAGLARVDFFVHPETEQIYVNEINTMPGFTSISMYPKLWEASGLPYTDLISRLIDLGLARQGQKV